MRGIPTELSSVACTCLLLQQGIAVALEPRSSFFIKEEQ